MTTISELFQKGGPVVWILAAYSSVGLAIVLERYFLFLRLRRLPGQVRARLGHLLDQADAAESTSRLRGPEAEIVRGMIEADRQGVADIRSVGERIRTEQLGRMEFGLPTLSILGNTAPLLGLLGTITGMIKAFMVIEAAGGKVDAQALAGGIWEAMITTGVGLAVAIPLLILLHFLEGTVERRGRSMQQTIDLLLERRNPGCGDRPGHPEQQPNWERITDGI
ncbi:MAG TPA: MotA/TolQ/ExbB proton channel family protein [Sedimenticola thiotaurini]|uniref:MotA/TolQ/ExbB proton channel family protein n=1 Tax=Sedimenticola thiotaurini TaxID=1543721 RepID=A0A831RJ47_9GAMM|nr:MotA/TolQ/ExbB proton channel family protein [Sedimenticola thiotaurini]